MCGQCASWAAIVLWAAICVGIELELQGCEAAVSFVGIVRQQLVVVVWAARHVSCMGSAEVAARVGSEAHELRGQRSSSELELRGQRGT